MSNIPSFEEIMEARDVLQQIIEAIENGVLVILPSEDAVSSLRAVTTDDDGTG